MGQSHISAIIGGTHLGRADKDTIKKTIQALKNYHIDKIGVSHCTGLEASLELYQEFRDHFFFCNVGQIIER